MSNNGLELYHAGASTCSQRVRFVMAEKGIDYESRPIRLELGEHLHPEYLAVNPNGLVPAIVHNGRAINDSSVINEYLNEVFPGNSLIPEDPYQRAQMRAWVQYLDEVMTPSIRYPSFQKFFGWHIRGLSDEQRQEYADRLPLRKHFALEIEGKDGFPDKALNAAIDRIRSSLKRMEAALSSNLWLVGDELTLADIAAMPSVVRLEDLGRTDLYADLPHVQAWYKRLQEKPAFFAAYPAGSRLGEFAN